MQQSSVSPLSTPQPTIFPIQCHPTGPMGAKVMIVGEAPGEKEAETGACFAGPSGWLLNQVLEEAGLTRGACLLTNVARERPPGNDISAWIATPSKRTADHVLIDDKWVNHRIRFGRDLLFQEVAACRPTIIFAAGNLALWALTGEWGIRKWRGSLIEREIAGRNTLIIPVIHPAAVLREWPLRQLLLHDLKRGAAILRNGVTPKPEFNFIVRPTFEQARDTLARLLGMVAARRTKLSSDIETRAGHTACLGIAWSKTEAICIPFMCVERLEGYWTLDEEVELVNLIGTLLSHPNADVTWQNGAYDHQYEHRWHWYIPRLGWDTMLAHHAMFSVSPKSLDHLSSLYCAHHRYWKDDGRNWDPSSMPEDQYWFYNCEDCVRTFEIREEEEKAIATLTPNWPKLPSVVAFQHRVQPVIVKMMLRGVRSDDTARGRMAAALMSRSMEIQNELTQILGEEVNTRSPKQMVELFYSSLGQQPIYSRNPDGTRGNPTCDEDALRKIAARQPLLRGVVDRILALRSAGVFLSTFVQMRRDIDGRLRCAYNVAGTKTYRLNSSENAFGSGGNLQNVPEGDESEDAVIPLPNIRKLFLPDPGKTWFDLDGDSADLRIVTGESGCRAMQAYFEAKVKPYVEIAKEFYRDPTITKHHRSYKWMKALCHGSNYGGEPAGLSERIGLPVHDVERMQRWYFGMCPEIKAWQEEIKRQIEQRGWIENPFGYRLYNWDRISRKVYNDALAWTPQSTVGILINKIAVAIDEELPDVELLLQVHDSLDGQFPTHLAPACRREILRIAESVEIPCQTGPIRVPAGLKTSTKSWGDCE